MKNLVNLLVLVFLGILTTGCEVKHNHQYYMTNPEKLIKAYRQCHVGDFHGEVSCDSIDKMVEAFKEDVNRFLSGDSYFGLRIIKLQNELANTNNAKKARILREKIEQKMSVVRYVFTAGSQ